ncbi:MAG: hypothetical protein JM58_09375 [Peptococcaceae bacterium BICA1-8]|nr:MAG: hypothetical protein JM58_09375 [Peptococcaceae bacterium BICA1-8]
MILGIDAGNSEVKVCGEFGVIQFPSDISEWRELKLKSEKFIHDIEWEYQGKRGFAGTLAQLEGEFSGTQKGDTKAHEETLLRVLFALHNYSEHEHFKIVVGQPISQHTAGEKEKIKKLLLGNHEIKINGVERRFYINRVEVAAEEASSFWCEPEDGLVRIIGVGAGTIGCATLFNKRYVDKESFSLNFGADTVRNLDYQALARKINNEANWDKGDRVKLIGGLAEHLFPYICDHYPKTKVMYPIIKGERVHPIFCNCVGFYEIARGIYGD